MNGAEALAKAALASGINRAFCHAGGTISLPLAALKAAGVELVVARHEAQAVHMAQGAYRVSGRPQLVLVTSGPGVTNAVTGVADAHYDGDAVVLVCGQVSTLEMRGSRPVRQRGFQETPTVELMRPVSKASVLLDFAPNVGPTMWSAFEFAKYPRSGPVVLDFPMDVQRRTAEHQDGGHSLIQFAGVREFRPDVTPAVEAILGARAPVAILGRGCLRDVKVVRRFLRALDLPCVYSLPAAGVVQAIDPLCRGMLGHTGHGLANDTVAGADVVLALGARLDLRQVGTESSQWRSKILISVDHDLGELHNRRVGVTMPYHCSVGGWVRAALEYAS